MIEELTMVELLSRAALALVMGLSIGWDRETKHKAAGLRTMALVSLGSAGVVLAGVELAAAMSVDGVQLDPLRVISGIVGGIGFLGAGAIIQSGGKVHGLTTAASIWVAASLGIACGFGLYRLAFVLLGLTLVVLIGVTTLKGEVFPDGDRGP